MAVLDVETYVPDVMILWLAILVLTVLAVALGLWPLLRGGMRATALDHAIAFYEDRKVELERLEAEGQISAAERKAAEAEQGRRLIAINRSIVTTAADSDAIAMRRRKRAAIAFIVGIPVIAIGIYLRLGAPNLPDTPLSARKADPQSMALLDAVRQIEQHLLRNPNDGRGYEVVAPVYLRTGRLDDAAKAYTKVIELLGENAERLADLGESLVAAASGVVNAEARAAFERSIVLDPGFAKSRFYLAIAVEQDGNPAKAYADLLDLAKSLPEGGPRERVIGELQRFQSEGKAPAGAEMPAVSGPESDAGRAIAAMPQGEQATMIRSMVEGLATRVAQSGGTFEEWYRLIQARLVLGEPDKAAEHMAAARKAHAHDPKMLERLAGVEKAFRLPETKP